MTSTVPTSDSSTEPSVPPKDERIEDLPAFDRVQKRDPETDASSSPWGKSAALMILVLAGIGLGIWFLSPTESGTDNLLVRLVETSATLQPDLLTTVPDEAHDLILDQLGWSVPPPEFTALALVGASVSTIGEVKPGDAVDPVAVQIPAFRYEGASDERAHVFAYDYILLDRVGRAFDLPEAAYAVLSEPNPVDSRVVDGNYVVTWRRRAMIFSAVTADESVAERIRQTVVS